MLYLAFRFLVENILDSISDQSNEAQSDELFDEIEELENLTSFLEEPTRQIQAEFSSIRRRNPEKLKLFAYLALQQKQMKFLKFISELNE